jgi:prolyl-tRNA editing enzyme YbaK/EbsC (Cys-tRNA(Pro) deacylase)
MELSPSVKKVQTALHALSLEFHVKEFPQGTRTAQDAANAIGCSIGQIVKSLIFKTSHEKGVLILTSGANRIDEKKVAEIIGESIYKANADFVRAKAGFVIGGVPPLGHSEKMTCVIDEDLLQYSEIWAAAGTPNTVFRLRPKDLLKMNDGVVSCVRIDSETC